MSHANIHAKTVADKCEEKQKSLKIWIEERNGQWERDHEKALADYEAKGWLYKLFFSKPSSVLSDFRHYSYQDWYEDSIRRIEGLIALADQAQDNVVSLSWNDAQWLKIDD